MDYIKRVLKNKMIEFSQKHGNGKWAYEELEWWLYETQQKNLAMLNEDEMFEINTFMNSFRSLYK